MLAIFLMLPHVVAAQPATGAAPPAQPAAAGQSASDLAKQTQNPIASLISVPFQGNWDSGIGDRKATSTLLNFQPVVPFPISPSTNVILRVIMPMTSQPSPDGSTRYNGLGDVITSVFLSPSKASKVIWGAGPVATANWKAKEVWSAPLLFSVNKIAMLGKRPVNLTLAAGPHVLGPARAPSWRFRLAANFLFPR